MPIALPESGDKVRICVDRGGTFCDVVALSETKGKHLIKLLSVDPAHYDDAPREGVRRALEWYTGEKIGRHEQIDTTHIEYLRMGTTVATNALLERKGDACALLITKGHRDCLEIGNQTRPYLFQLAIKKPQVLYSDVVEVNERIVPHFPGLQDDFIGGVDETGKLVEGVNGTMMVELEALSVSFPIKGRRHVLTTGDVLEVTSQLQALYDKGYRSVAIVFAHSYLYPNHEKQVESIAHTIGFPHISVSSDLQAMINLNARGSSATADAYLTPAIRRYLDGFAAGFKNHLKSKDDDCRISFMQSDGALCDFRQFSGLKAILSGPAAGVVGFARTSYDPRKGSPVVGFDMGGTSTDVSRYSDHFEHVFETTTAGVSIQTPQLDINTVAAGGGSILSYKNGLFMAGPESAGAHPGPACYRKGGPLTVTDANLFLGRLHIASFPKIFGPTEDLPLDLEIVKEKMEALTTKINAESGSNLSPVEVACGFISVANNAMARPIRALTEQRGFRTSDHDLACFGGAGGQHACALAALLGMPTVVVHKYSSVLSAYGMSLADIAVDLSQPSKLIYGTGATPFLEARFSSLREKALEQLQAQGLVNVKIDFERYLNMRYTGSDTRIMIKAPEDNDFAAAFVAQHRREFSFSLDASIEVDAIRIRAIAKGGSTSDPDFSPWVDEYESLTSRQTCQPFASQKVFFESHNAHMDTPLYRLDELEPGMEIHGPAILLDDTQTIILHPSNAARSLREHLIVDVGLGPRKPLSTSIVDPIQLSIFGHRFMGIAEQMGRSLQKTAVSLQIKERLDYSCAIFGPDAQLVANAPNVPVHLGSMQYAVAFQNERFKGQLRPGDVLVSNQPEAGGTHLPDITVMQPVFEEGSNEIVFWAAARGHHTDIGGLEGSPMHPATIDRAEEGATFFSTFLVRDGEFNEAEVVKTFAAAGKYPNCMETRRLDHNISDLKAQCAACAVGVSQIQALFMEYGKEVVQFYMKAIRDNSALAVRNFLKSRSGQVLRAEEFMDDGTPMRIEIDIDPENGTARFDFTGTGEETLGNFNAPMAVALSGITFALRTLIGTDLPMNSGVLAPIEVIIPQGCLINPSGQAPVYLGNADTAQRVADVIFTALEASANSMGTNNATMLMYKELSWGDAICGGAAAGPGFSGQSAVQVNMTNTRNGDTEIFESRFPAILREFSVRRGSGGKGKFSGGDGAVRIYEGRVPLLVHHAGERRVMEPKGLHGGGAGRRGASYWRRKTPEGGFRLVKTRPSASVRMKAGESFIVMTPGGGGYGGTADNAPLPPAPKLSHGVMPSDYPISIPRANGSLACYVATQEASN